MEELSMPENGSGSGVTRPVDEKVYVAVREDVKHGKTTLQWALQNLAKDGAMVVLAHVHGPAKMIPMMGAKIHHTVVNPQLVRDYRRKEREKVEEKLDKYVVMCTRLQVRCEKLIIEKDDVSEGLQELIAVHGVTKFVIGAAADKHYSRKMKAPKSKTALRMMQEAASSCKIWFTCKGNLICTREVNSTVPAIPAPTNAVASTVTHSSETEVSSSIVKPKHDMDELRTQVGVVWAPGSCRCSTDASVKASHSSQMDSKPPSVNQFADEEPVSSEFSSSELEQATRGFDEALKIGKGGFGTVYKGLLQDTTVAIKLLHPKDVKGQLAGFNEQVASMGKVRHPNLVTLLGVCWHPKASGLALVYEFFPNGNLEDRLARVNNTPPLTWQARTRIICEMCSALTFLHSMKPKPVVHGNLKPANILLDANLVSKVGGFGICRLLIQSATTTTTTKALYGTATTDPMGSLAYTDPEFLSTGDLTTRSDVYSFGIIILRLLTGRPPQRIAELVEDTMERGQLHSILDPSAGSWPFVQVKQLAQIGLLCAEMSRRRRPDLAGQVCNVVEPLTKAASKMQPSVPSSVNADTPSYFICPILQEVMSDPHVAADGFTYEAEAIRGWLASGHDTSPMTNVKLAHRELTPNRALRSAILEWQQQQQSG